MEFSHEGGVMEDCHGLYLVVYLGRKEQNIFRELAIHSITFLGIVDLLIILQNSFFPDAIK